MVTIKQLTEKSASFAFDHVPKVKEIKHDSGHAE